MLLFSSQSVTHIVDLTRILLQNGDADPDIETERGLPIYYSYEGNIDGITLLLNQSNIGPNINDYNVYGWGVLHEQVCYARYHDAFLLERLQFWFSRGANANAKLEKSGHNGYPPGTTPLHVACKGTLDFSEEHRYLLILKPGFLELFLQNDVDLHAVDKLEYTIMRYISTNFPEKELVWWFNLLDSLHVDLIEYLETECRIYQNSSFDPLKTWRNAYLSPLRTYWDPKLDRFAFYSWETEYNRDQEDTTEERANSSAASTCSEAEAETSSAFIERQNTSKPGFKAKTLDIVPVSDASGKSG